MNNSKTGNLLDIDFKDLALLLLKRLWLIILCFALFFSYKWFLVETKKSPTYTANASMYVSSTYEQRYIYSTSDAYNAQSLIKTCGVAMNQRTVRTLIAENLNKNESIKAEQAKEQGLEYKPVQYTADNIGRIQVAPIDETEIMSISVTSESSQKSIDVCNAIIEVVPDVLKTSIGVGAAEPLDNAIRSYRGNNPNLKSAIVFGIIGAAAMAIILVIAYLLDNRIRSKEEITEQYGIPVLSDIPNFNVKSKERYTTYYEHR